ncbi:hypothetical protein MTR_7g116480 [Medicago truncatula]|uniref:Uncharacterized protein n=1 Tax=Medicago truncatula TaxID=3880 RepID=G7L2Y4_MEDTR|nr:hypothetical protein MTR_7g116480 [Medicago truncatula]
MTIERFLGWFYAQPFLRFGRFFIVDSGNNDFVATTAIVDATHPYGLELTLPYLSPLLVREKLVIGANFASTGLYSSLRHEVSENNEKLREKYCKESSPYLALIEKTVRKSQETDLKALRYCFLRAWFADGKKSRRLQRVKVVK